MSEPFRTTRRVEFAETDMAGIAHFSNFFRWMESAEVDFLSARGLNVSLGWHGQKLGFPRVSASCDYLRPVTFMDRVDIAVSVERIGTKSVTYAFEFSKQGELVARGRVTSVCCLVKPGDGIEAVQIPDDLRARLLE
jgi:YbgC/YbaW family acyl-CoA thioester hydrolase